MAHGDGWLQRQKSGIWYAIWWVDGTRHRRSTRTRDRDLAERELERFRGVSRETRARDGEPVLSDAFSTLAAHWRNQGKASLKSLRYWERAPKRLLGDCTPIGELSADRIDRDYTTPRITEGVSRNTVRVELAAISSALKLALVSEAPKLRRPPEDFSRVRQGFLSPSELERVAAHLPDAIADFVRFLFWSGWRSVEARYLCWSNLDDAPGQIRLGGWQTKEKHPRTIPLSGRLAEILDRARSRRITSTDLVFHRDGGLPIKDIRKRIDTAADRAGVSRFRPHDLRRSFVKFASDEGIDATTIMRFTGHRTDSTFRRYRIVDLETLERASAALSFAANRAEQATNRAEPEQLSLPPYEENPLQNRGFSEWSRSGSNRRPLDCQSSALPTELRPRMGKKR